MDYNQLLDKIYDSINEELGLALELNQYIFNNPEPSYKEYLAYDKYLNLLKREGIEVEERFLGNDTAFKATIHEDKDSDIKIGILAEYDALPEIGHACGHCASGALSFLAALGLYKNREFLKGNIYLFGTPGEEANGFKVDMADSGLFDDFSYVIMIHMSDKNQPYSKLMALDAINFEFFGSPSHASASPWDGKNAVNGMTLFIHALDMMRQQLRDGTRIHGTIIKGGSVANVIPDYASCEYWFRYKRREYLNEVIKMVYDAAEGCAKATQTSVKITEATRPLDDLKAIPYGDNLIKDIYENLGLEIDKGPVESLGSSDIGNLSYKCPALHPTISISDRPVSTHTREFADLILSDKTKWAIEKGSKVIATYILKSLYDDNIIKNMKKDFEG